MMRGGRKLGKDEVWWLVAKRKREIEAKYFDRLL